jgi:hypothetical protein
LYASLVVDSIEHSNVGPLSAPLPRYGLRQQPLKELSLILVELPALAGANDFAFLKFGTTHHPFDTVIVLPVDASTPDELRIGLDETRFRVKVRLADGETLASDALSVAL